MNRRGFTLLETVMASVVGAIVAIAAFALLSTVRRTDEGLKKRVEWINSFANTQRLVRRSLTSLAIAPDTSAAQAPPLGLPRFSLTRVGREQRLELLLTEPLLGRIEADRRRVLRRGTDGGVELRYQDLSTFRGVFETVPEGRDRALALYWRPLPPAELPPGVRFDASTLPEPIQIASGLSSVVWQVMDGRDRVGSWTASSNMEMPAYAELELRGSGNGYANFLFPLDWADVSEEFAAASVPALPDEPDAEGDDEQIEVDTGVSGDIGDAVSQRPESPRPGTARGSMYGLWGWPCQADRTSALKGIS
ncbi:MAG: prepilin-type N-terminal cleavage/methylation domain-containing protein [Planctomycetota bacterium]